jgi:predicted phage tail protein
VAPSNLTVALLSQPPRARLTWVDNSNNENLFQIWRSTDGGAFVQIATMNRSAALRTATGGSVTFTNGSLTAGSTYAYYVIAVNTVPNPDEPSAPSNTASTTVPTLPAAPSNLAGSAVVSGAQHRVTLTWIDNSNNEVGFQIQRSTSPTFTNVVTINPGPNVTTFIQNVSSASDYYYRIRATNQTGNSDWSNVLFVPTP